MEPTKLEARGSPTGWQRLLFRAPIWLYRAHLGMLLGRRICMLEHRGRHSGLRRRTVLEVVARGDQIIYVAAAWGRKAEWLKNIKADPHVIVHSGGDRYESDAAVIAPEEAQVVLQDYARRHPRALRGLARFMLGKAGPTLDETVDSIATTVPMVALPRSR